MMNDPGNGTAYFWSKRAGDVRSSGAVPHVGPSDFSAGPTWSWPNSDDELMRHGPVIDAEHNIYLATANGWIRKFNPTGEIVWSWRTSALEGKITTSLVLHEGGIFFTSIRVDQVPRQGFAFSMDMSSGDVNWRAELPPLGMIEADSHTVFVYNETFVTCSRDSKYFPYNGNNKIYALNSSDGRFLWDFVIDQVVWNFMPCSPGDGTILFSTPSANAYRLRLGDGSLVWKSGFAEPPVWLGTGGGALGPNGVFYAEGTNAGGPGTPLDYSPTNMGIVIAYRVSDGTILWYRRLPNHLVGNQYPAVGGVSGQHGSTRAAKLAVVIAMGHNTNEPRMWVPGYWPSSLYSYWFEQVLIELQLGSYWIRRLLGIPILSNSVWALDAESGQVLWRFDEEPWDYLACAGDEQRLLYRAAKALLDPTRQEVACVPDSWGIPTIGGDGTVYLTSGHNGNLYAVKDVNGDGVISPEETSTFSTSQGFLNGPALAPGMLVASPCWGPMYVFKGGDK
eukprot:gnl/TRDRNA2_/TRDRNA2_29998_c0_seq1.p1 gnl/TRDRNA2_/TRDRNA2_29998_c0~~gnl/TRDRNA2_/TRDRNA2_29998_c0_seq1.p1  ORF type:complete len:506 (-),score=37.58 gnl/TRDRNA2_/TRDRNA2_29998_c0_seq1:69-1586(-)